MKYKIIDWDGEEYVVGFVGKNKDELISYLMRRIGDIELEISR